MPPSETFSGNPDDWWSWPGNQFDAEGRQKKYTAALAEMEKSFGMKIVTENHSVTRLLTAGVLYVLLPGGASPTILTFLTAFLVAQTAGSLSYVPGGSGVFETALALLLAHSVTASGLVGALLLYRLLYYLLPLAVASALWTLYEYLLSRRRRR